MAKHVRKISRKCVRRQGKPQKNPGTLVKLCQTDTKATRRVSNQPRTLICVPSDHGDSCTWLRNTEFITPGSQSGWGSRRNTRESERGSRHRRRNTRRVCACEHRSMWLMRLMVLSLHVHPLLCDAVLLAALVLEHFPPTCHCKWSAWFI